MHQGGVVASVSPHGSTGTVACNQQAWQSQGSGNQECVGRNGSTGSGTAASSQQAGQPQGSGNQVCAGAEPSTHLAQPSVPEQPDAAKGPSAIQAHTHLAQPSKHEQLDATKGQGRIMQAHTHDNPNSSTERTTGSADNSIPSSSTQRPATKAVVGEGHSAPAVDTPRSPSVKAPGLHLAQAQEALKPQEALRS